MRGRCAKLMPSPVAVVAQERQQRLPSQMLQPSIPRTTIHSASLRLHIVHVVSRFPSCGEPGGHPGKRAGRQIPD
jgi:hypothetical protein